MLVESQIHIFAKNGERYSDDNVQATLLPPHGDVHSMTSVHH